MTGGVWVKRDKDLKGIRPALEAVSSLDRRLWVIRKPAPPVWVPDRQVLLPAPTSHCHRAETQVLLAPKTHSVHSNMATAPDQPPDHRNSRVSPASSWSHGAVSQSQTFTVHTCLPQTVFVKYQCICCPGGVPNSSCTIHTIHSFFLSVFYVFFFF